MTVKEAIDLLKVENKAQLAHALGLTPSAVYQWPDTLPLYAEGRVLVEAHRRQREEQNAD